MNGKKVKFLRKLYAQAKEDNLVIAQGKTFRNFKRGYHRKKKFFNFLYSYGLHNPTSRLKNGIEKLYLIN